MSTETNDRISVEVLPVEEEDYSNLRRNRYFFDWKEEESYNVFKLVISGKDDILGLASLAFVDAESRIEIRLLAVSKENRGSRKQYDRIAGCLIGFAAKEALRMYDIWPCVSLKPKSEIRDYYKETYYMKDGGASVFCDGANLVKLSMEYE